MTNASAGRAAGGARAKLLWAGSSIAIALGYALLAGGGTTIPTALLVLGYVVLAPLAIRGAPRQKTGGFVGAPYGWAALLAASVLTLYVATLAPTTAMWDTSEYITAAKVLGIPHPPGNPLFVLLAHLFGALPIAHDYAVRINLLAAAASAAAAGIWFLVAHEVTRRLFAERWAQLVSAAVCAALGATSFTVWNQSVVNEKVYTVSLLQLTVVVWLAVCWPRQPKGAAADRLLILIVYLLALGYTIHPAGYLAAPSVLAVALVVAPKSLFRARIMALAAAATVFGLSLFAFEPIRSANQPSLNEGEPTGCRGGFALACTLSTDTLDRLRAQVERDQYGKPDLSNRQAPFGAQLGMWWQYFSWQWFRDPRGAHPSAQLALALFAIMLALAGGRVHARADRTTFVMMATLVVTLTIALVFYLNFKYGYSQSSKMGAGVPREVRDRDYFFLWGFSCLGIWSGLGLTAAWRAVAARLHRPGALALALPVLALGFLPLALNARAASRAGQTFTRDFARDLLASIAPSGILVTNGDNDTFPLWYAQQVEGYRRDVVVIVATHLGTDWFPWQLLRRGIALAASPADADAVPQVVQLSAPQLFEAGDIHATVPAGYLTRDQLFVLRMVRDVLPHRPLYFSSASYPRALGLGPYLVTQGLAVRLMPTAVRATADVVRTNDGMVDVGTSLRLWRDTFKGRQAFESQGDWIDVSSLVMPAQYVIAGSLLAEGLQVSGRAAEAHEIETQVQRMLGTANLASVFARED